MKITAGISNVEQYKLYMEAGADEVFFGWVPDSWNRKNEHDWPLNRREAGYCPVQIGGKNELRRLVEQTSGLNNAIMTLNSPCYRPSLYPEIADIIRDCIKEGINRFILADPGLILYLHSVGLASEIHIHISGEAGEINRYMLREWIRLGAKRVIFHRKVGLENIRKLTSFSSDIEYEAFIMNERCHFHGAFCSSLHCDEFAHFCHLPWHLAPIDNTQIVKIRPKEKSETPSVPGFSGCGLCSLWKLKEWNVTHLKVVGRGAGTDEMIRDIHAVRTAVDMLELYQREDEWKQSMLAAVFPDGCAHACYY